MIHAGHLAPMGCWDTNMLFQLMNNELYPTGQHFHHTEGYPDADGAVMVIPGRYWFDRTDDINEALARYDWVLAMRTGDEEDVFNTARIKHPNIVWWVQTPRTGKFYPNTSRFIGCGWTPHFNNPRFGGERDTEVMLAAQNTHQRRKQCFEALQTVRAAKVVHESAGFTQGMAPHDYVENMTRSKVALAPSGAFSPDSFRLFEALQAHAVPLADDESPNKLYDAEGFWRTLFPDAPFPIYTRNEQLPGYIADQLALWPANSNRITVWWMRQKRALTTWLLDDLKALGAL